jgi:predicted type IV restriction endonuclease
MTEIPENLNSLAAIKKDKSPPKWEVDTRAQIKSGIRSLKKPLQDLIDRDAVEADTRLFITDFMEKVLGYDKYANLTAEYQVKGDWADYGVRIDGNLIAFIEAKRVSQPLSDKHLKQVQSYAVNEGVDWLILTNAKQWQVYHIKAEGLPIQTDLVIDVDLVTGTPREIESLLFHIHHVAMKKKSIIDVWKRGEAMSDPQLRKALLSAQVVNEVRLRLAKQTGVKLDESEVLSALKKFVME